MNQQESDAFPDGARAAPERRRKRCGYCGEVGHSKLVCPNTEAPTSKKGTVTCSQCNQQGHNSRKCPQAPRNTSVTCSLCGATGHNCRTCPLKGPRKKAATSDGKPVQPRRTPLFSSGSGGRIASPSQQPARTVSRSGGFAAQSHGRAVTGGSDITASTGAATVLSSGEGLFGGAGSMPAKAAADYLGPLLPNTTVPLPQTLADAVNLACAASYRAWLHGVRLQTLQWPVTPVSTGAAAEDSVAQFDAIVRLSELMLRGLKQNRGLEGSLQAHRFAGDSPSGSWHGDRIAAFICPTVPDAAAIAGVADDGSTTRIVMTVNPAWLAEPTVDAPPLLADFEPIFSLTRHTVDDVSVSVLKVFSAGWHVYACPPGEEPRLLCVDATAPSPRRLRDLAGGPPPMPQPAPLPFRPAAASPAPFPATLLPAGLKPDPSTLSGVPDSLALPKWQSEDVSWIFAAASQQMQSTPRQTPVAGHSSFDAARPPSTRPLVGASSGAGAGGGVDDLEAILRTLDPDAEFDANVGANDVRRSMCDWDSVWDSVSLPGTSSISVAAAQEDWRVAPLSQSPPHAASSTIERSESVPSFEFLEEAGLVDDALSFALYELV